MCANIDRVENFRHMKGQTDGCERDGKGKIWRKRAGLFIEVLIKAKFLETKKIVARVLLFIQPR